MDKICSTCKEVKPLKDFYDDKRIKSGKSIECKICVRARSKQYAEKNTSKIRVDKKQYYLDNIEKWRVRNGEEKRLRAKEDQ